MQITGSGTTGNVVAGNYIGTDARGTGLITGNVAWYKGEGNANDSAGTNNGTLVGDATYAAGKVGQGFSFGGTGGYVQTGYTAELRRRGHLRRLGEDDRRQRRHRGRRRRQRQPAAAWACSSRTGFST